MNYGTRNDGTMVATGPMTTTKERRQAGDWSRSIEPPFNERLDEIMCCEWFKNWFMIAIDMIVTAMTNTQQTDVEKSSETYIHTIVMSSIREAT